MIKAAIQARPEDTRGFAEVWPAIDGVDGFLMPGQERWLFNMAANLPDDAVIVEIGSFLGRSTTAMAFASRGSNRKIFAIDTFQGNTSDFVKGQNNVDWEGDDFLAVFKDNLARNGLEDYVIPVKGTSGEIGRQWDKPIDFLFVDGSHEFEDVVADFELYLPWVKPGAMLAFHDVQPAWEGPYRAWQDVIRHRLENPSRFFSIAFGRKPYDAASFEGRVHVIVPVHNRERMTRACLNTLNSQVLKEHLTLHVVDDGSTDGTASMLENEFPDVHVIKGDGTLWWTGAVAKALEEIRADFAPGDYFLLVNNDVVLSPETVEILVRESIRLKRAAVAPIAINDYDATSTGWGDGTALILNDFERQFRCMKECSNTLAVESLFGRCSLYPVEVLDLVGNFDAKAFPHYHGDTDFGLRARRFGFPIYVTGSTCIRVREDPDSTGSHYSFRQDPQPWAKVKENMFSPKSIDNVPAFWRYMSRHYPKSRYRQTYAMIWSSLRQWEPLYDFKKRLAELKEDADGRYYSLYTGIRDALGGIKSALRTVAYYPRATVYLLARPKLLIGKLASLRHNRTFMRATYYPRAAIYLIRRPQLLKQKLMSVIGIKSARPTDD